MSHEGVEATSVAGLRTAPPPVGCAEWTASTRTIACLRLEIALIAADDRWGWRRLCREENGRSGSLTSKQRASHEAVKREKGNNLVCLAALLVFAAVGQDIRIPRTDDKRAETAI
uniref:Uncharacterized protein n=1 Tax=Plectus sambesii TaxID=2011161 RepID=A0A914WB82_9BILA